MSGGNQQSDICRKEDYGNTGSSVKCKSVCDGSHCNENYIGPATPAPPTTTTSDAVPLLTIFNNVLIILGIMLIKWIKMFLKNGKIENTITQNI